jgi:hypothetical protein
MARPPSGQPHKERIALTLSPEIMQKIREMATKEKSSISVAAERLLIVGLMCPHCNKPHYIRKSISKQKQIEFEKRITEAIDAIDSIIKTGGNYTNNELYNRLWNIFINLKNIYW